MNKNSQKPEDQRVRVTKTMFQEAFLRLLAQKPVQSITIKELCAAAGVNRGTFYLHYHDTYDLLQQVEDSMLEDLDALLDSGIITHKTSRAALVSFMAAIVRFFDKNRELCAVLLGDNGDKKFINNIIERARDKSVREYQKVFPGVEKTRVETFYYFIAWGFIGLIQHSLYTPGAPGLSEIAADAEAIIMHSARVLEG